MATFSPFPNGAPLNGAVVRPHPIPAAVMPLISPSALLHAHLQQTPSIRRDGRAPSDTRPIQLTIGSLTHANGSSLVRIGSTTCVAGVRAEILPVSSIADYRAQPLDQEEATDKQAPPLLEDSESTLYNLLVPNLELSTGSSPALLPGSPPGVLAQSLSHRLLSLLQTTRLIPPSQLRILHQPPQDPDSEFEPEKEVKAYWVLYIDIICISADGALFECAWLALLAALKDTLVAWAWWDADLQQVICSPRTDEAWRLRIEGSPVPLAFACFEPSQLTAREEEGTTKWVLVDPDAFEEGCCGEQGCVVIDGKSGSGEMVVVDMKKNGGGNMGKQEMRDIIKIAERRWVEWTKLVQENVRT